MISKKLMRGREYMILNEIDILKKISQGHKNILSLWDYFETPNNLYLVMDLCTGGELFDRFDLPSNRRICDVGQFYEKDAAKIILTVLDPVRYLHGLNVVHRDIKPENLLFKSRDQNSDLLIADFGLSKILDPGSGDEYLRTTCGTPGLCGYMPFESAANVVEIENVLNGVYTFDEMYWKDVSLAARDFISHLLVVDPQQRMTVERALNHPWITNSNAAPAKDLFPNVRKGFNARKTFKKAIDVVKAVNKLSSTQLSVRTKSNNSANPSPLYGTAEYQTGSSGNDFLAVQGPYMGGLSPLPLSENNSMDDVRIETDSHSHVEKH
ncbi:hypothetical protein HDV03_002938 [Kappamyces sp. JEL0829]|nr:hypothetical protein HDV03_002938 [Kappamyces sp. JEL0829]